ncbi:MAG: hypothetical protein WCG93_14195 [Paludibacter sp.]
MKWLNIDIICSAHFGAGSVWFLTSVGCTTAIQIIPFQGIGYFRCYIPTPSFTLSVIYPIGG